MKFSQDVMIRDKQYVTIRDKVIYVPYLPRHTEKYHGWMTDPLIRAQTASEPLSMEEEYDMQVKWSLDADKRTFILVPRQRMHAILASQDCAGVSLGDICTTTCDLPHEHVRALPTQESFELSADLVRDHTSASEQAPCQRCIATGRTCLFPTSQLALCAACEAALALGPAGLAAAVGDVNLFMHHYLADEDETGLARADVLNAEIEVMVAEQASRRGGVGRDAVEMVMRHGREEIGVGRYVVKINDDNVPSLALFASLGFTEFARVECFREVHMHWLDPAPPHYDRAAWCARFGVEDCAAEDEQWEQEGVGLVLRGAAARESVGEAAARDACADADAACAWRGAAWVCGEEVLLEGDVVEEDASMTISKAAAVRVAERVAPWRVTQLWEGKAVDKALALLHAAEDAAAVSRSSLSRTTPQLAFPNASDSLSIASVASFVEALAAQLSDAIVFEPSAGGAGKVVILRKRVSSLVKSVAQEAAEDVRAFLLAVLGESTEDA